MPKKLFFDRPPVGVQLKLLASFGLAILLGLVVGSQFIGQQVSVVEDSDSLANAGYFFLYVLFSTALLLLLLHYYKGKKLFFFAELLLEFSALQILFALFSDSTYSFFAALAVVALRVWMPALKQPLLFIATMTVGALLGSSFGFVPAFVLSFLLAAYDYFAVFKSKHMVTLAKELQSRQAAFAIEFRNAAAKVSTGKKPGNKAVRGKKGEIAVPAGDRILLGTGDFVIPVMLSVSLLKISVFSALAAGLGAFVGLSILLYIMQKTRGYYPALPPIVLFASLFYALSLLVAVL
ncbi:TPA: hypothetical protein HA244_07035 [Candidatus Micrarchaeota archaeon]|nr:hypothetical protein [Candidatus Micrarchaeota archaeon]